MMNRIMTLVAVLGVSMAGAACQNSGGFTADADTDATFNSTSTASTTEIRSNDKMNIHNNIHSKHTNNPTAHSGSDVGSLGNPGSPGGDVSERMSNGTINSSGTASDR